MRYADGQQVELLDHMEMGGSSGVVVADPEARKFSPGYPEAAWGYLKQGLLMDFEQFGLAQSDDLSDVTLVRRNQI